MQFGLFYEWPNPTLRNWKTLYQEGVEEILYSEEMGFDYCLIAEHHFSNYGNSPAPLLQALHIGQQTKRGLGLPDGCLRPGADALVGSLQLLEHIQSRPFFGLDSQ